MHLHCMNASIFLIVVIIAFLVGFFGHRWVSREERRELNEQIGIADVLLRDIAIGASPTDFRTGIWRRLSDYLARFE